MKVKSSTSMAVAIRPRPVIQAVSFFALVALGISFMVAEHSESGWVKRIKYGFVETISPVIDLLSEPAAYMETNGARIKEFMMLYQDNQSLRAENKTLMRWQTVAAQLESENRELRKMLGLTASAKSRYTTARIVSDTHDPMSHSLFIKLADNRDIRAGLPVISAEGIIGHIIEVQDHHAKVLLITDRQSRIPVQSEASGQRAILAGTNDLGYMQLNHVEHVEKFSVGDRIVTNASELFPVRMAIGEVVSTSGETILVKPYVDTTKLHFVSIVIAAEDAIAQPYQ